MTLICQYVDTYPYSIRRTTGTNFPQFTRNIYSEITNLQSVNSGSLGSGAALNFAVVSPGVSTKIFVMAKINNNQDTLQFQMKLLNGITDAGTYVITANGTDGSGFSVIPMFINFPITSVTITNTSTVVMKWAFVASTAFLDGNINDVVNTVTVTPEPGSVWLVDPAFINNFPVDIVAQSIGPILISVDGWQNTPGDPIEISIVDVDTLSNLHVTVDNPIPIPVDINSSVPIDTNATIVAPLPVPVTGGTGGPVVIDPASIKALWNAKIANQNQIDNQKFAGDNATCKVMRDLGPNPIP